jgi:hypothetical protein
LNQLWKNKWVRWLVLPVALIVGVYQFNYPTCTFRYKLTAEVMTPEGLRTGSSVIEVSYSSGHPLPNPGRWRADFVTGEAVYVDLGGGKNLFVLLGADRWERTASRIPSNDEGFDGITGSSIRRIGDDLDEQNLAEGSLNALWLPVQVFKLGRMPGYERDMQRRANALRGQAPVEVPLINAPLMGRFEDLAKPETFNTMLPTKISKVLGDGYVLQSLKMQIVNEEPGEGMRNVLPWLTQAVDRRLRQCNKNDQTTSNACQIGSHQIWASNSAMDYVEY